MCTFLQKSAFCKTGFYADARCSDHILPDVLGFCVSGIMSVEVIRWGLPVFCCRAFKSVCMVVECSSPAVADPEGVQGVK